MISKTTQLNSQIFNTGTKFIVTEDTKDNTFGPGTIGFISYVKGHDQDYTNVVYLNTVIIKRGKTGKRRISNSEISTPVFDFKDDNLSKVMPEEKRRYYVHIEPVSSYECSVQSMSDIDFLGWSYAMVKYMQKLSTRAKHIMVWPTDPAHFLNQILNISENYMETMDSSLTNPEFRDKFIKKIRMMESTLVRSALLYMCRVSEIENRAIIDLCQEGLNIGDKDVMQKTMDVFKNKREALQVLTANHGNINMINDVKKALSSIQWL